MKILFKKDSEELRDILGFVDKDFTVSKIQSEIFTASRELIKLVGPEVYAYAVTLFNRLEVVEGSTVLTEAEKFFLYNVRYPIALDGYRNYAPSGDINHTKNGRKMKNQDNETAAWEWMVNRNDEALEKQYYKALDNLLDLLDEEDPILIKADGDTPELKWKGTEAFLKTHKLYVRTTGDFDAYFPINSRLLLLKLQPGLYQCERLQIIPRIGKEKNTALKTSLLSPDENLEEELIELIKEACVFFALAWAIRRLRVSLLPEGILQRYNGERVNSRNTKVPEKMEAELAAQSFEADAEKVLAAMDSYITAANAVETSEEIEILPGFDFDDDDNFVST